MAKNIYETANYFLEPEYITEAPAKRAPTGSFKAPAQTTQQFGGRQTLTPKDMRRGTSTASQSTMAKTLSVDGLHAIDKMDFPFSRKMLNKVVNAIETRVKKGGLSFAFVNTDLDEEPNRIAKTMEIEGHTVQLDEFALSTANNADKMDMLTKAEKSGVYILAIDSSTNHDGIILKVYISAIPTDEVEIPSYADIHVPQRTTAGFNFKYGVYVPVDDDELINTLAADIVDACTTEPSVGTTVGGRNTLPALIKATTGEDFPNILEFVENWTIALSRGNIDEAKALTVDCHKYILNNLKIPKTRLTGKGIAGNTTWQRKMEKMPDEESLIIAKNLIRADIVTSYNRVCAKLGISDAMLTEAGILPQIKNVGAAIQKFVMKIWSTIANTFKPLDVMPIEDSDMTVADVFEETAKAELKLLTNPAKAKQDMEALLAKL